MPTKKDIQIVPTILANTQEEFHAAITVIDTFANRVQIDIVDGEFASNRTVGLDDLFWPDNWLVDIHMMVKAPSRYIDKLILMKPHMVIFHAEVEEDLTPTFEKLRQAGIKSGLALLRGTVPYNEARQIAMVDHVMIFAGELGQMGGKANLLQVEKVRLIKEISPNVEIGWDGGANIDTLTTIMQSGVDVINVGGAITNAKNPAEAFKALVDLSKTEGVI